MPGRGTGCGPTFVRQRSRRDCPRGSKLRVIGRDSTLITVSVAGLVAWTTGAFVAGIAYGRWRLARALANRTWLEQQQSLLDVGATAEARAVKEESP